MKKINFIIYTFLLFLLGCNKPKFEAKDFIGVWKSDDGASITINKDGSCVLNNLNYNIINITVGEFEKLNTNGTWEISNEVNNGITGGVSTGLHISYKLIDREGKGGIDFYIRGQGLNENKPPWNLFVWSGDPDDNIKYEFIKQ